jgi:hypothetical protein
MDIIPLPTSHPDDDVGDAAAAYMMMFLLKLN